MSDPIGDAGYAGDPTAALTTYLTRLSEPEHGAALDAGEMVSVVRTLLDAGADPTATVTLPDNAGRIPLLFFPSVAGIAPVVRLLLERGAQPTDGESLYHAAQHDHRDVLALLVEFGADLSRGPAGTGNTPLHFLASHHATNELAPKVVRGMQWLLAQGADPTIPLTAAGDGQHPSQLGETPLHRAAANGYDSDVLAMFVEHGADLDAVRRDGATPYTLAVRNGNAGGAMWLASNGADRTRVSVTDRFLCACLTNDAHDVRSIVASDPGIVSALGEEDAMALLRALEAGNDGTVRLMLSVGWPLEMQSEWGGTALHWAAWSAQVEFVRLLLQHGAPVNAPDTRYGSSPIAWAAHGSRFSGRGSDDDYARIVDALIDAGATREASINRWQESPESMASPAVVAALRMRGFVSDEARPA